MKDLKAVSGNALAELVLARQKFVEEIIRFAESIVYERGKVLRREEHFYHITTTAELNNFAGFSFYTHGAFTDFGGDNVKIWYHPDSKERGSEPVFEVDYWDIAECKVKRFDPSPIWQQALQVLIKDRVRVVAQIKRGERKKNNREKKNKERETELKRVQSQLEHDATRLKLR
ncbi:MAG: hypothetical protein HZA36_03830 [Parcubacteria group bacterium]|nr:hypothetical protein [Parcubacteria group bacterium]